MFSVCLSQISAYLELRLKNYRNLKKGLYLKSKMAKFDQNMSRVQRVLKYGRFGTRNLFFWESPSLDIKFM